MLVGQAKVIQPRLHRGVLVLRKRIQVIDELRCGGQQRTVALVLAVEDAQRVLLQPG